MKAKILIIEDSLNFQLMIKEILKENYQLTIVSSGSEAMNLIHSEHFDLYLIDIMLPDINGMQICSYIKSQKSTKNTPVIFLTSKSDTEDVVKGFDIGADDYIKKPFHYQELLSRVKSKIKNNDFETTIIEVGDLRLDLNKQEISTISNNEEITLTPLEFKLALCLFRRIDHVLSRQQILDIVWPNNLNVSERTVDSHISNLRKKLQNYGVFIKSIHGNGYKCSVLKEAS